MEREKDLFLRKKKERRKKERTKERKTKRKAPSQNMLFSTGRRGKSWILFRRRSR